MDKTYQPHAIETSWYQTWESENYFAPQGAGESYTIMIPPPNVTGSLHMGHGFNNAIMDALIRFRRMQGRNTLWQPGTDHAGIATQMLVERQLEATGQSRHDLGREKFLEKIWEWKDQSGGNISRQIRRLGSSVDWSRERFTMDDGLSEAVKEAFVRLHEDGLIYRGKRLVNWDTKLHTAISDLEVENHDEKGFLWNLKYPLADGAKTAEGNDYLIVATTRPETMLGDAAVAVNPNDERYQALIGKFVELPLVGRRIPIIADDYCDPEFGTGCVKITPAHDFNDYEVGKRHNLPLLNIFDKNAAVLPACQVFNLDGTLNDSIDGKIPAEYAGLDRFEARKQIVAAFDAAGLLVSVDDHALKVPKGDRSGTVIEPWLTDQWYVSTKPLAEPAIAAVEDGRIQFVPKQYENMYFSWMRDIQDWCISRQLWWGHRIPAWYDESGKVYVGRDEAEVRAKHNLGADVALQQDNDVLDTWFSSGLWTFSTLGWPQQTEFLKKFHSTDVLVTGFDIIFFWVARMIMLTMHLSRTKTAPRRYRSRPCTSTAWCAMARARRCPSPRATSSTRWTSSTASTWKPWYRNAPRASCSQNWRRRSRNRPATNSPTALPATAPTPCASLSAHWRPPAATSSSTWAASKAIATSVTRSGTPRATCWIKAKTAVRTAKPSN